MQQKIKFDLITKVLSGVVMLIPLTLLITHHFIIKDDVIIPDVVAIFLFIAFGITWMLHPTAYEITTEEFLIHRPKGPIRIKLNAIQSIEKTEPGMSIRLFGSGGLFGYFGLFSSKKLGKYYRYTGSNSNLVCITCTDKKYVVSIHEEEFYQHLLKVTTQ